MSRLFSSLQRLEITSAVVTAYPYTIATWAYDDGTSTVFPFLVGCSTSGTTAQSTRLQLSIRDTGLVAAGVGTVAAVTSTARPVNTWFHACAVHASTTSRAAYLDGGSKGTNTTSQAVPANMNRTTINAWNGGSNVGIAGNIAHPAIWNVALTDAEVAMLASGLSPLRVRPQSLIFYLPTLGRDSPEIDIIGAQTFTVHGATASSNEPVFLWPKQSKKYFPIGIFINEKLLTDTHDISDDLISTSTRGRLNTDFSDFIDASLPSAQRNRFSVDLAELSDASDASILRAREALEALLLADQTQLQALRARAASESLAIDDLSILYAIRNRLSTDAVSTVLDEFLSSVERSRIDSDSISAFDALLASVLRVRFSDDLAELLDAFNAIITSGGPALYDITITDPLAALDFVLAQLMITRAATDSAEIQDALIAQASRARIVSDIAAASDEAQRTAFRNIELIDSAILLDAKIEKVAFRNLISSDSLASNDESLRATARTITIAESLILSEEVARQIVRLLTSSDLIDVVEARDKVLSIVSTISELLGISEEIVKAQIFGTFFDVRVILGSALLRESIRLSVDRGVIISAAESPKLGSYN